jgi:alpha-mannosidase
MNGIPAVPNKDQLDGAAKDWYPIQRWVDVSDGKRGATLVSLDAPLVLLGGITTGKWARTLEPEGPTVISWAMNNHWLVNFQAGQEGPIPLRYRLTTHEGAVDSAAAGRFAAEMSVPPVVLRDLAATGPRSDQFLTLDPASPVLVTAKPSENDGWIALRVQNMTSKKVRPTISFAQTPRAARTADPIEHLREAIVISGKDIAVDVDPLAVATVLVSFA